MKSGGGRCAMQRKQRVGPLAEAKKERSGPAGNRSEVKCRVVESIKVNLLPCEQGKLPEPCSLGKTPPA
jgi:hypothetical protein